MRTLATGGKSGDFSRPALVCTCWCLPVELEKVHFSRHHASHLGNVGLAGAQQSQISRPNGFAPGEWAICTGRRAECPW